MTPDQVVDLALVGATLIDGTGAQPVPDSAIVLAGDRIDWIGPSAALDPARDLQRIEVRGKYVVPGLLDANAHLVMHLEPDVLLRFEPGRYDELVLEAAQVALRAGITTVFDTWGPLESLKRVRDRIDAGGAFGSRIFCAGNIIGNGGPWSEDFSGYADTMNPAIVADVNRQWEQGVGAELTWMPTEEVREAVRAYIANSGIDFVKYSSNAHRSWRFIAFAPRVQRAIVEEAHAAGKIAQACALTPEGLNLAIEAGVDLLQHANTTGVHPLPEETLEVIVERRIPSVAMLYTSRFVDALRIDTTIPEHWRRSWIVKNENARRLIEAGATLMLATDGGIFAPSIATSRWMGPVFGMPDVPFELGRSHILWFRAARELEMAPMDALVAATRNIAVAYGRGEELGTVEPGKRADLLVLDADPLDEPENYARIACVVKDGRIVDRDRLPEQPVLTREA